MNEMNTPNVILYKSIQRLFIASIVTLVFGFLYFALLIFAYSTMSYFSLGLDYFFLSDTAKIIIHLIASTPAILLMVGGILGIWMKKRPDKIMIPLVYSATDIAYLDAFGGWINTYDEITQELKIKPAKVYELK
jgi:hypothetical protein